MAAASAAVVDNVRPHVGGKVSDPSTEYLQLPFVDVLCVNIYLEWRQCLEGYLARVHNAAGERPPVLADWRVGTNA